MATDDWWDIHDPTYAERQAAGHDFRGGELTPGWCVRCGGARFVHDPTPLPLHRTEAGWPNCSTCDGGGCYDCTDPA